MVLALVLGGLVCLATSLAVPPPDPNVILVTEPSPNEIYQWVSAVRLRNGDLFYVSNRSEEALLYNNLNVFAANNLYYFQQSSGNTTFLTYLVPGYAPLGVFLLHPYAGLDDEATLLFITTAQCVVSLPLLLPTWEVSLALGNCYASATRMRDGPLLFARFFQIQGLSAVSMDTMVLLDSGVRLCLVQNGLVTSTYLSPMQALAVQPTALAIAWRAGGFSLFPLALPQPAAPILSPELLLVALSMVTDDTHNKTWVFALDSAGSVIRYADDEAQLLGSAMPSSVLLLDFPYGLFVMDPWGQRLVQISNLGCLCPPGFTMLQVESTHCQPAPAGGFVDVLGTFSACPPGTFGLGAQATTSQACQPCPPFTISNESQSTFCTLCPGNSTPDPSLTACLPACPQGTQALPGACRACPPGQTLTGGRCQSCPANTYSPAYGAYACAPCAAGSWSAPGASACSAGTPALHQDLMVFTVAVLGVHPIDMAVASNGTVYIAAFELLLAIDRSGGSTQAPLTELAMVRALALKPDESVLYAAISEEQVLGFTSVGTVLMAWTSKVWVPQSVTVGLAAVGPNTLAVWDAAANAVLLAPSQTLLLQGGMANTIVAMKANSSLYLLVMLQNVDWGNQSILQLLPFMSPVQPLDVQQAQPWNPYLGFWRGVLILSSHNAILGLAGSPNQTGRVDGMVQEARFTAPGPMAQAPNPNMLLVADQNALRVLYVNPMGSASQTSMRSRAACPAPQGSCPCWELKPAPPATQGSTMTRPQACASPVLWRVGGPRRA